MDDRLNHWSRIAALLLLANSGCNDNAPSLASSPQAPAKTQAGIELTVLVVDDPALADGVKLLRGEWNERSGGSLKVRNTTLTELLSADRLDADVVIYRSRQLGELADREWLRPLRQSVLDDESFNAADIFPLARTREMSYAGEPFAAPLACDAAIFGFGPALLNAAGGPPTTWEEVAAACKETSGEGRTPTMTTPITTTMAEEHRSACLLILAAACSTEVIEGGFLFDPASMRPRIETPPFVRALGQIASIEVAIKYDDGRDGKLPTLPPESVWAEPPAAQEIYGSTVESWRHAGPNEGRATLLAGGAVLASVTTETRNTASAYRLLGWLTSGTTATQLGRRSSAPFPCRRSQVDELASWGVGSLPAVQQGAIADLLEVVFSQERIVQIPRIPGIEQYLTALDQAVASVGLKESQPADALREAADAWEQISERLGRDRQQAAYRRHLGLDDQ